MRLVDSMGPFQTAVTLQSMDGSGDGQEVIEVQILPQDDNWGENTTAITGNTSEHSHSTDDLAGWLADGSDGSGSRRLGAALVGLASLAAFLSPPLMVTLPQLGVFPALSGHDSLRSKLRLLACGPECKGALLTLAFKLAALALGVWAVFFRRPIATLPRIFLFRALLTCVMMLCLFAYWLFYITQVTEIARTAVTPEELVDYRSLVAHASNLADVLLFLHYVFVVMAELRHLEPRYYIKVIRSPDGESRSYAVGQLSIQRAAVWVLQRYYTEFPIYNPYLERLPVSKARKSSAGGGFKYYEVDGVNDGDGVGGGNGNNGTPQRTALSAQARRRDSSHNERFYEEHEYERRVKKRRARLLTAAEEAFTHIRRLHNEQASGTPMDAQEAAQAIFPTMARSLQKYLRITRQQPRHTVDSILQHLATCLEHDLAPRAFLEPYLVPAPVLQHARELRLVQTWSLVCDALLSRPIAPDICFKLVQGDVSLLCLVRRVPHLNVVEEVVDPKCNRFVLRLNSETSV